MTTICKQTSLYFSPYVSSKSKKSGEIPKIQPKIKIKHEEGSKDKEPTLEKIQTERTKTNGLGFYPKKYSSLKKKNEELSCQESHNINMQNPQRKSSKQKQSVKIAFNYTNYYLNAHLFKKKSFQKSTGHTYTQQRNMQFHDEEFINTWSKRAKNFNSSIYNMLKDHKKKLKKNNSSEQEPYSSLLTEQPNKIKLNITKQYDSKLNFKILANHMDDPKMPLPPYQQSTRNKKSFPSNQKFSKKGYHNSLMKQKIQRCYKQKDYQERMLTVGNFQSEHIPQSFRKLELFEETLQRIARNKSHGIQLPLLNTNSQRNITFDFDNQIQNHSQQITRDSPSKEPSKTEEISHRKFETQRQTLPATTTKKKKFYSYIQHKESNSLKNSHSKNSPQQTHQFVPQLTGWETKQHQEEEFL